MIEGRHVTFIKEKMPDQAQDKVLLVKKALVGWTIGHSSKSSNRTFPSSCTLRTKLVVVSFYDGQVSIVLVVAMEFLSDPLANSRLSSLLVE